MKGEAGTAPRRSRPEACPICGKPAEPAFVPFCSQRCADVDLGRWLGERYVVPGPAPDPGAGSDDTGSD